MCDYSFVRRYDVIDSKGNRFYIFSRLDPYEAFPKRFPSLTVLESPFLLSIFTPLEYLDAIKRMGGNVDDDPEDNCDDDCGFDPYLGCYTDDY